MGLRKLKSLKHNGKKLVDILEAHERYWASKEGGARADLTGADLSGADLSKLNLAGAILQNANLEGSDLRGARLPGADFSGRLWDDGAFFRNCGRPPGGWSRWRAILRGTFSRSQDF